MTFIGPSLPRIASLALGALVASMLALGAPVEAKSPAGKIPCKGGKAAGFPCKGIDLQAHMPRADVGNAGIADVWGWHDKKTGKEYALLGSTRGLQFVDVSNPTKPVFLGTLAGKAETVAIWMELEVYKDHAFVVCDLAPCGLQIFDLTRLRDADSAQTWTPDRVIPIGIAHTVDHNPDTGMLYVNGSLLAFGSFIFDINDPLAPRPVGGILDDGYTHDTLCRNYKGPDKDHKGSEVCFSFNEDTVTIYDVTNKTSPEQLARADYDKASYTHSGALTKDHSYLISTDEGDETGHGIRSTLYIWDVRKLAEPKLIGTWVGKQGSIDHNLYPIGNAIFHANYTAGLRILDANQAATGKLKEVAYFDIVPDNDNPTFTGTWAAYPYLPSGNVLIGDMSGGLFIVKPDPKIVARAR